MSLILKKSEIDQFKNDGAVLLKSEFELNWIIYFRRGLEKQKEIQVPDSLTIQKIKIYLVISKIIGHGICMKNLKILYLIHQRQKFRQNY